MGAAVGTWIAVVYGFGGYRWRTREFAPLPPTRAQRIRFSLTLAGSVLEVTIEPTSVTYTLRSGEPLTARHHGREFTVTVAAPVSFPGQYRTHDGAPAALPV